VKRENLPVFEVARVLMGLHQISSTIVNADHSASSCLVDFFLVCGRATSQDFRAARTTRPFHLLQGARVWLSKVP
jgi:hypothetical protein